MLVPLENNDQGIGLLESLIFPNYLTCPKIQSP